MCSPIFQDKLDKSWIEEFEKMDKKYEMFYKEDVPFVTLHYIYINQSNEIETIKEEKFFMQTPNILSREELIGILKKTSFYNQHRYEILSILKYNFHLDPSDMSYFLKTDIKEGYLTVIKNIDAIPLDKTIGMFQELNDILILFYEKGAVKPSMQTKRILLRAITKHRKTIRKKA